MSIHFVYTAKGALHPDREGALQRALLTSDEATARRLNSLWADAQEQARKLGWQGHSRCGPFVIAKGLIWDDSNKIWIATEDAWIALEGDQTAWKVTSRHQVIS